MTNLTGPTWNLNADGTVTVAFPSEPPVGLVLPLDEVVQMLEKLGEYRELMQPPVAATYSPGQPVSAIPDPAWFVEGEMMQGQSLLHLRDPRFGWLHYLLPRNEAERLGRLLVEQAQAQLPGPVSGKAS